MRGEPVPAPGDAAADAALAALREEAPSRVASICGLPFPWFWHGAQRQSPRGWRSLAAADPSCPSRGRPVPGLQPRPRDRDHFHFDHSLPCHPCRLGPRAARPLATTARVARRCPLGLMLCVSLRQTMHEIQISVYSAVASQVESSTLIFGTNCGSTCRPFLM